MKTKPESQKHSYLFLIDNMDLAFSIITAGYQAVALLDGIEGFFDLNGFVAYMDEICCTGTYQMDYCYISACSTKRNNDILESYFQNNKLSFRKGWNLFKEKEYLEKSEYQQELKQRIEDFILRFEGRPEEQPDLTRFHKFNEKGKVTGVYDLEIVNYLIQTVPFLVINGVPYVYENGCYYDDPKGIHLQAHIQKLIYPEFVKKTTLTGVYNLLISQREVQAQQADINNQPTHWINFKNGYFDVLEWKMIEHNPKYRMINQIPYEFHPEDAEKELAEGNSIREFLAYSMPNSDDQQTFWQYLGYCMTTDTRFQKFLMVKGEGGTGKSIVVSLIQQLVGNHNYCSIPLQDLNQRFYATGLFGKTLNACADITSEAMQHVDIVKKAVGEDTLLYEKKGDDALFFRSYAKLLFSANEMPLNMDDKTNAYYRRLLVIEMNHVVPQEKKDMELLKKLLTESGYAIHMAVVALKQLYVQKHFTESIHCRRCINTLYRAADSVMAFTEDKLCHKNGEKMKRSNVYRLYEDCCKDNGRTPCGKTKFWEYMKDKGYFIKRHCDGAFYFIDTALKDDEFINMDDTIENPFE